MLKPQLLNALQAQAELEFNACTSALALSLWADAYGWPGSHKWLGRFSRSEWDLTKRIEKFLIKYGKVEGEIPASAACKCTASNLPAVYAEVLKMVEMSQAGWIEISVMAEGSQSQDVDALADDVMLANVQMIKKLNLFMNSFGQYGDDKAAWLKFDGDRK